VQWSAPAGVGSSTKLFGRRAECEVLDRLIGAVRAGESQSLVVVGEPGVGKTALLDYTGARASGCRVVRAGGVQSEMELAFAGLSQLLTPMLDRLDWVPGPQRQALRTAFGISHGAAPDRFLVGMAALGLLSVAADEQPLICLVDDEQWLDRASAQVLGFVARRLQEESVGLIYASRNADDEVAGLPQLVVSGLREADARELMDSALAGPVDGSVRDRVVTETGGNPLALLELARGLTPEQLAGGFGQLGATPLSAAIEESFLRRIDALPVESKRLLQLAAADPTGDAALVWRAARGLAIGAKAATAAADAGLVEFGLRVVFRHPLVRSAAYRSASLLEQQKLHRALGAATLPQVDPARRAWHLAQAAPGPDESVAGELERSARRAQARGGLAAMAAFLERAALLTPDPDRRAQDLLTAAWAKRDAGAPEAALELLLTVDAGPPDALRTAEAEHLRGRIAADQGHAGDAWQLLLTAARQLEPLDASQARETHLEALIAATWAGDFGGQGSLRAAAEAARTAPPGPDPPRSVDVVLDALALRLTEGYEAAAPTLRLARKLLLAADDETANVRVGRWVPRASGRAGQLVALELWDDESWRTIAADQLQLARANGALIGLQWARHVLARSYTLAGDLAAAALLLDEDRLVAEVTGMPPVAHAEVMLAAWRGREPAASELIGAILREATARGLGRVADLGLCASLVLNNALGRHDAARDAGRGLFERDPFGHAPFVIPELAEAAARTGDLELVRAVRSWMSMLTRVTPTDWALGIEARVQALAAHGEVAESLYRESIGRLSRTRLRAELARSHLLYGEWLRRERRRTDAREQLRTALGMLEAMGIEAFAERARRELLATGETARKRTAQTSDQLTAQETQVAQLAAAGLSNSDIAARLFISPKTVEYHLRKVFAKLGISSRVQLAQVYPHERGDAGLRLGARQAKRVLTGLSQYFGPTYSSSLATASRRATEIVFRREKRQLIPSRSSASPHNPRMSADSLVNMYRGYSYQRSPSASGRRTRLMNRQPSEWNSPLAKRSGC
jgi:DNA-binding CsgD family transcriptional regulator